MSSFNDGRVGQNMVTIATQCAYTCLHLLIQINQALLIFKLRVNYDMKLSQRNVQDPQGVEALVWTMFSDDVCHAILRSVSHDSSKSHPRFRNEGKMVRCSSQILAVMFVVCS
jgi:hypothetical protein